MLIAVVVLLVFVVIMGAGIIAQRRALWQQRRGESAVGQEAGATQAQALTEQRRHRAGDVLFACGPDLVVRQAYPISLFLLGYPPEALAGTSMLGLVHPDDAGELAEFARLRGTSGPATAVVRCHHRAGSWVWLEAAAKRDHAGDTDAIDFVARDIHDRRRAEDWLVSQRSLADAVLSLASDAVISMDAEGRIVAWNRAAETMLGWSRDEVIGHDVAEIVAPQRLRESYREDVARLWNAGSSGRVDEPTEAVVLRRDGYELPVEATAWTVDVGETRQLTTLIRDVSARKQAESAMAEAREQALEASRLKSEFLATTSHEIRTPMNGVIGLTGLLLETDLDGTQRRYADGIRTAAGALLSIINDILDYSKLESGRVSVEEIDFDLRELVEEVVEVIAATARVKSVEVVGYCQPGLPVALRGDPGRLRQVLLNLAGNAAKFTERGEVVVRARWADAPTDKPQPATIRFEVADTGIGIAEADRERMFEAFSQADGSTTRRFGGTGLGLAIARRLVEAMGGHLRVDSELGRGSTFWFEISLSRQNEGQPVVRGPADDVKGLRVLIVDDNVANQVILEGQLRAWRMVPTAVTSQLAAIQTLRQATARYRPYDVVIVDTTVSGLDGVEMAREITADPGIGLVHVVLLTPDQPIEATTLRSAGVAAALTKPVNQSALFESLARALVRAEEVGDQTVPLLAGRPAAGVSTNDSPPARTGPSSNGAAGVPVGGAVEDATGTGPPVRGTVLLAKVDDIGQQVATAMLARLGYYTDVVDNAAAAIDLAGRHDYDAVLMDVQLPELDGFAATAELRHRERADRHTPVIALTGGDNADGDRDRGQVAGMDDYLAKPIMPDDLREVLERWVGHSASSRG